MTARTCAGCDLCCTVLDVDELDKPAGARCQHLDGPPGRSCSIYPTRPLSCETFICFWRAGFGPEKFRPSDVGFALAIRSPNLPDRGLLTLHSDPDRPESWRTTWALPRLKQLAKSYRCAIAVNQGADREASFIISPAGNVYDREHWPKLFEGNMVRTPLLDLPGAAPCQ